MSGRALPFWTNIASNRLRAVAVTCVFAMAVLRFTGAVVSAIHFNQGDFAATLPGPYAEHWNLTLWDSPDLEAGVAFHRHSYGYGPTQYLTLWPIVFLNSYRQIAAVLLPVYIGVVVGTAYLLWRVCDTVVVSDGARWGRKMSVYAAVLLFGPTLVALGQREFEVVQALFLVLAAYFAVRDHPVASGVVLGYVSMFKYWTLGLSACFVLRRQWKPALAFVATVAAVLVVAHVVFDLGRFPFAFNAGFNRQFTRIYQPLGQNSQFCSAVTGTAASLQMGLCAILGGHGRSAEVVFYGLLSVATIAFLVLFGLLERGGRMMDERQHWRGLLELCFFLIGAGVVFHAHYYYLSILILPLTLLLYRAFWLPGDAAGVRLAVAIAAYVALSAFVVPPDLLSRATGVDVWSFYLSHGIYVYGYVLLAGLLFWEYGMLLKNGRGVHHQMVAEASS